MVAVGLLLLAPGGCVNLGKGTRQATKLYVLHALSETQTTSRVMPSVGDLTIGVGPVELPEYLDRPQLVIRASRNELQLADFAQWAEPLRDNVTRVLVENLSILLATERVSIYPRRVPLPIDYQVALKVARLDVDTAGKAWLRARWAIFGDDGKKLLLTRQSSHTEPVAAKGHEAMVAAESRALEALSREIAAAINDLAR
jgi:uncharacterized lipoprotein YmbA